MLTELEAVARAKKIWGHPTELMRDVTCKGAWFVGIATDAEYHHLDGNGHATCHKACTKLEEQNT